MQFFCYGSGFYSSTLGDEYDDSPFEVRLSIRINNNNGFIEPSNHYYYLVSLQVDNENIFSNKKAPVSTAGENKYHTTIELEGDENGIQYDATINIKLFKQETLLQEQTLSDTFIVRQPHAYGGPFGFVN